MYDSTNIFAKMISGDIEVEKIYEDEFAIAINDINPAAKIHALVIPKIQCISFDDFAQKASPDFMAGFLASIRRVSSLLGVCESGYRLIMNHGAHANQTVGHYHVHILGGQNLGALVQGDAYHA